jgi:two-component system cell cycle sensor histidine kinase/response regulator CckA
MPERRAAGRPERRAPGMPDRRSALTPDRRRAATPQPSPAEPSPEAREDEGRFRRTFERAPIAIAHITPDGRWIEFNQRMLDLLGYSSEELHALRYADLTHPDDAAVDQEGCRRVVAGEIQVYRMEKRYIRKDGAIVWGRLCMSLVRTAEGAPDYLIATVEDITELKATEDALRASEKRYAHIAANVPGMVYQFVRETDGSIALPIVGDAARELFGLEPDAIQQDPTLLIDTIHPADRPSWDASVIVSATSLAPWRWEGRVRTATGEERWIQGAARPERQPDGGILWDGLLIDVTEQRKAATQLEESEQRYRSMFDHHPDAVFSLDLEGRFSSMNPACEVVSGYRPDELVGRSFDPILLPAYLETTHRAYEAAAAGVAQSFEVVIRHRSGREVPVSVTNVPIIVGGAVVGVFGIAKDLTIRRSLEAQLLAAQRMEAVGRLAGGVAHEINNALQGVRGFGSLALEQLAPRDAARADLEEALRSVGRATEVARQLLAFTRQQVLQPQHVPLSEVVADFEPMLRQTLGPTRQLRLSLTDAPTWVFADRGQLEQVLLNLVLNACDAMPDGGLCTIVVDRPGGAVEAAVRREEPAEAVRLQVRDTGIGMDEATLANIFEPFFTTKPAGHGTGLGLPVVSGIVEQSGGRIETQSAPGKGTTIGILMPLSEAAPADEGPVVHDPVVRGSGTILVVDDEPVVRRYLRRQLEKGGYHVLDAGDGEAALRMLEATASAGAADAAPEGAVDLVITDIIMPRLGGRELAETLKARYPGLPVVFMSGYTGEELVRLGSLGGDVPLLQKPFTPAEMYDLIRDALGQSQAPRPDGA